VAVADASLALLLRGKMAPRAAAAAAAAAVAAAATAMAASALGQGEVDLDVGRRDDFPSPGDGGGGDAAGAGDAARAVRRRQLWPRALLDEVVTCSGELEALGEALAPQAAAAAAAAAAAVSAAAEDAVGESLPAPFAAERGAAADFRAIPRLSNATERGPLCPRARSLARLLARLVGASEEHVLQRCEALELLIELYTSVGGAAQ